MLTDGNARRILIAMQTTWATLRKVWSVLVDLWKVLRGPIPTRCKCCGTIYPSTWAYYWKGHGGYHNEEPLLTVPR